MTQNKLLENKQIKANKNKVKAKARKSSQNLERGQPCKASQHRITKRRGRLQESLTNQCWAQNILITSQPRSMRPWRDPWLQLSLHSMWCRWPVDGGKNPLQQRGSLLILQVPIRLTNVWYGRSDRIMDPLPSRRWFELVRLKQRQRVQVGFPTLRS